MPIALQLNRPPSRQKPPPEALHLWAPGEHLQGGLDGVGLGSNGTSQRARPRTAAASTFRTKAVPSVQARCNAGMLEIAMLLESLYMITLVSKSLKHGNNFDLNSGLPLPSPGPAFARPPTRQKPPPLSVLLEHSSFDKHPHDIHPPSEGESL